MRARLRSLEQFMPFATAGELIAAKRQLVVSVKSGATALYLTGLYWSDLPPTSRTADVARKSNRTTTFRRRLRFQPLLRCS
jgi:hypothetical protein